MLTVAQREELFNSVDLRHLTGQQVPSKRNQPVRVDCPVHGGAGDLAIYPNHAHCFSANCGWTARAFDTAAVLLGYYSKTDPLWPSKSFKPVMAKLEELKAGYTAPVVEEEVQPPTEAQLMDLLAAANPTDLDSLHVIDKWRGWPLYTSATYGLQLTKTAVVIPVRNSKGKLLTIRYRIRPKLEQKGRPKYWGVAGTNDPNILFGGSTMPPNKGKVLVLVEGEFDTISSQLAGVPTLNFINGAGWKDGREVVIAKLLRRFERILIAYDQDEAGRKGDEDLRKAMNDDRIGSLHWSSELGSDPNEVVKKHGTDAWKKIVKNSLSS